MYLKTNVAEIEVDGKTYNSKLDWNLAIENTDYVGEPVQDESNIVYVPGRSGPLDLTEQVFGGQHFLYREISVKFGGDRPSESWDGFISEIRNIVEGKIIKIRFLTDSEWYWTGRAKITEFGRKRRIGTFQLEIPFADPYKHRERRISLKTAASGTKVVLENSRQVVFPMIGTDAHITISYRGEDISLPAGSSRKREIKLFPGRNEMTITGNANVTLDYLEGSL